jgi:hypothetical protein
VQLRRFFGMDRFWEAELLDWSGRLIDWAANFIGMGHRLKKLSLPVLTYFGALIIRTKINGPYQKTI